MIKIMKKYLFRTFISLISFFSFHALLADKVEPPKDAVAFRGSHYKAFLDTNSTWWEAKFACDDIGGQLVVISTEQENEFVRRLTKDHLVSKQEKSNYYFLIHFDIKIKKAAF